VPKKNRKNPWQRRKKKLPDTFFRHRKRGREVEALLGGEGKKGNYPFSQKERRKREEKPRIPYKTESQGKGGPPYFPPLT